MFFVFYIGLIIIYFYIYRYIYYMNYFRYNLIVGILRPRNVYQIKGRKLPIVCVYVCVCVHVCVCVCVHVRMQV